jgi:hypothetical protein
MVFTKCITNSSRRNIHNISNFLVFDTIYVNTHKCKLVSTLSHFFYSFSVLETGLNYRPLCLTADPVPYTQHGMETRI